LSSGLLSNFANEMSAVKQCGAGATPGEEGRRQEAASREVAELLA